MSSKPQLHITRHDQVAGNGLKYIHEPSCGDTFAKMVLFKGLPAKKRCVSGGIEREEDTSFS